MTNDRNVINGILYFLQLDVGRWILSMNITQLLSEGLRDDRMKEYGPKYLGP